MTEFEFTIVLLEEKVTIYEKNDKNNSFKIFRVKGEEYLDYKNSNDKEEVSELCDSIFKSIDDNIGIDIEEISLNILYKESSITLLEPILTKLLPCKNLKVASIENELVTVLLKSGKIAPNKKIIISFDNQNYKIELNETGVPTVEKTDEKGVTLTDLEVVNSLNANFRFISNQSEIEKKDIELKRYKDFMKKRGLELPSESNKDEIELLGTYNYNENMKSYLNKTEIGVVTDVNKSRVMLKVNDEIMVHLSAFKIKKTFGNDYKFRFKNDAEFDIYFKDDKKSAIVKL